MKRKSGFHYFLKIILFENDICAAGKRITIRLLLRRTLVLSEILFRTL